MRLARLNSPMFVPPGWLKFVNYLVLCCRTAGIMVTDLMPPIAAG